MSRKSVQAVALAVLAGIALTACKPTAEDIELALGARGLAQPHAQCIGEGLEPLTEDDWTKLASLAATAAQGEAELRSMTMGEVEAKLRELDDPRLVGVLVRTGVGCTLMHGEFQLPSRL
ncbi:MULTISPECIES: hypothetical protein [Pacificimonas]|uniref:Lipoprotein n=1 Tax=Pacificimonas aurantium TaxID=1250540 RepID=A0ABS7WN18_9SPHN|nr:MULTISPECIES: hypothetical protein [Pacificimonas]MBZ6379776.1 hypothetical protein [Pacificimonas aurantium]